MNYKLNARHLILDILYASQRELTSIKQVLCAADLLGISDNGVRVAMTRLCSEGVIQAVERGLYQVTEKKFDTHLVSLNKTPNMRLAEHWQGHYFLVYTGNLGRVDRTALSKREKALRYYGFQELEQNVFIRPDNLNLSLATLKAHAVKFGLDQDARFFHVNAIEDENEVRDLWDIQRLNRGYAEVIQQVGQWFNNYQRLDLAEAAKTAFYTGKHALFTLRADPVLPAEWIDANLRSQFEQAVRRIEHQGQILWEQYFAHHEI